MNWSRVAKSFVMLGLLAFTACSDKTKQNVGPDLDPPAPPKALKALFLEESAVRLIWADQADNEEHFIVERGTSKSEASFKAIATLDSDTTAYEDKSVGASAYWYRVKAQNDAGDSAYSEVASIETFLVSPLNLAASFDSSVVIRLGWQDNGTRESGFVVERSVDGSPFSELARPAADISSLLDGDIENSRDYRYRVKAYNASHESGYSNEAELSTALLPPANVQASFDRTSEDVHLTWDPVSANVENIVVERMLMPGGSFAKVGEVAGSEVSYVDAAVANRIYHYRLRSLNTLGSSEYSSIVEVNTTVPPLPPDSLLARGVGGKIYVFWHDPAQNELGFVLERALGSGAFEPAATLLAGSLFYIDSSPLGPVYRYRIKSFNSAGESPYSAIYSIDTSLIPSMPADFTATRLAAQGVYLQWTDTSSTEDEFLVDRAPQPCSVWSQRRRLPANSSNMLDAPDPGTSIFCYRVKASNSVGESEAAFVTINSTLKRPTKLVATVNSPYSRAHLTWQDNSANETGFIVERSSNVGASYSEVARPTASPYNDTTIETNKAYIYRVRAYNAFEESANSELAVVATTFLDSSLAIEVSFKHLALADGISLKWADHFADPMAESGFRIERYKGSPDVLDREMIVPANSVSYLDKEGLEVAKTYYYRIQAICPAGGSNWSEPKVSVNTTLLPKAPSNLRASEWSSALKGFLLSWQDNSDNEESFIVQYKYCWGSEYGTCPTWVDSATLPPDSNFFRFPAVPNTSTPNYWLYSFLFRVVAKNAGGETHVETTEFRRFPHLN